MALIRVVAVLLLVGFSVGQDFADNLDQQWPAGISPLDSLSFWDEQETEQETPVPVEDSANGCCLPKQFTSRVFTEIRQGGRTPSTVRFVVVAYVDQDGQRTRSDVTMVRQGRPTTVSYIAVYNKTANNATVYTFFNQTQKCTKNVVPGAKFPPVCLPNNSTFRAAFYFGAAPRTLNTQTWSYVTRGPKATMYTSSTVIPDNCVPVVISQKIIQRRSENKRMQVTNVATVFTNSTTTTIGSSVFTPPSYCNKMDDEALIFDDGDLELASSIANRYF